MRPLRDVYIQDRETIVRRDDVPCLGQMRHEGKPRFNEGYIFCNLRVAGDRTLGWQYPESGFDLNGIMRPVDARELIKRWNHHEALVQQLQRAEARLMLFQVMHDKGEGNISPQDDLLKPISELLASVSGR